MGKFIVIDGIDGSGKTTQAKLLAEAARQRGLKVAEISFPAYNHTTSGAVIRQYLAGSLGDLKIIDPKLIAYIYATDRFEQKEKLKSLISTNDLVISTRYVAANIAYQTAKLPIEQQADFRQWCAHLDYKVFGNPREDALIFVSLLPELALKLRNHRAKTEKHQVRDIHEENDEYLRAVYEQYRIICKEDPHCFEIPVYKLISGKAVIQSIEETAQKIQQLVFKQVLHSIKILSIIHERKWSAAKPIN